MIIQIKNYLLSSIYVHIVKKHKDSLYFYLFNKVLEKNILIIKSEIIVIINSSS